MTAITSAAASRPRSKPLHCVYEYYRHFSFQRSCCNRRAPRSLSHYDRYVRMTIAKAIELLPSRRSSPPFTPRQSHSTATLLSLLRRPHSLPKTAMPCISYRHIRPNRDRLPSIRRDAPQSTQSLSVAFSSLNATACRHDPLD